MQGARCFAACTSPLAPCNGGGDQKVIFHFVMVLTIAMVTKWAAITNIFIFLFIHLYIFFIFLIFIYQIKD